MMKHTALKQNNKDDTCIEFRRDMKTLTADTTFSGNFFHSWTTRQIYIKWVYLLSERGMAMQPFANFL